MAEEESGEPLTKRAAHFDGRGLMRLGLWSFAASAAVMVAVLVASSETGLRRLSLAFSNNASLSMTPQRDFAVRETAHRANEEMQRLSETLRQVNTDRIRMITRLEAIERHLDDITGSINRGPAATAPTSETAPTPSPETTTSVPGRGAIAAPSSPSTSIQQAPSSTAPQQLAAQAPAQEPPAADTPVQNKADFGVDLGGAQSIEGLRALWTQAKGRHGGLLDGLRPIMTVREASKPGGMELRLVAGPLPSATLAARLCVTILAAGAPCQPALFDGQRLALR